MTFRSKPIELTKTERVTGWWPHPRDELTVGLLREMVAMLNEAGIEDDVKIHYDVHPLSSPRGFRLNVTETTETETLAWQP
jgi:hypothetical protein